MDSQESQVDRDLSKMTLTCEGQGGGDMDMIMGNIKHETGDGGKVHPLSWNPLEMKEVVDVVMKFCNPPTLKKARFVSQLWNVASIHKLYRNPRCCLTVPPNFYDNAQKEERKTTIAHMKQFLTTHQLFVPNIQILRVEDISTFEEIGEPDSGTSNPNRCVGPFVRKLCYGLEEPMEPLEDLLSRLVNLQVLDTSSGSKDETASQFSIDLPNVLKKLDGRALTLANCTMLSRTADGPQCFDTFKIYVPMDNIKLRKLLYGIVPCVNYSYDYRIPEFQMLQELLTDTLNVLMERNKNMLVQFGVTGGEMFLDGAIIPRIPHLKYFSLCVYPPRRLRVLPLPPKYGFPPGFEIATNFPSIVEMKIVYEANSSPNPRPDWADDKTWNPQLWTSYFGHQPQVHSLKYLSYWDSSCNLDLDPILHCFPKLENLRFLNPGDFSKVARSIFTLARNLKHLVLDIELETLTTKISSFDAIFTGFSQGTVDKIKNASKEWDINQSLLHEGITLEQLRVQPSLFDLPYLERLRIEISGDVVKQLPRKIFTVAGKYAFGLLPQLQVEISLVRKEGQEKRGIDALKEVSDIPNVTIL